MKTADGNPVVNELLDEKNGLLMPLDNINRVPPLHASEDVVAQMHPNSDTRASWRNAQEACNVKFNDPNLEAKAWPTLFPYGRGSWHANCGVKLGEYQRHRLLDIDPRFRNDPFWSFFNFDRRTKQIIAH